MFYFLAIPQQAYNSTGQKGLIIVLTVTKTDENLYAQIVCIQMFGKKQPRCPALARDANSLSSGEALGPWVGEPALCSMKKTRHRFTMPMHIICEVAQSNINLINRLQYMVFTMYFHRYVITHGSHVITYESQTCNN